jgi:hypothetical protein
MERDDLERAGAGSRAIWDWSDEGAARRRAARSAAARRLALIQGLVGAVIATLVFLVWGRRTMAIVILSLGLANLAVALVSPLRASAAIQLFLLRVGVVLGTLVSWLLLFPIFALFFVPFGLAFRRGRRDSLERWAEPPEASYWRARDAARRGPEAYRRQF